MMLGYSKSKFGCWITRIEDDIAYVTVCDPVGEKSYMEIPIKDLKDKNITCKVGTIFIFILRSFFGFEKISFEPTMNIAITKKDIEKLRKKSTVVKNEKKARKKLAEWEKKMNRAKNLVKKYKKKVKYYDKKKEMVV